MDAVKKQPSYLVIANVIKDKIAKKEIKPGQKLPSLRTVAKNYSVSLNTVKSAYEHLVSLGLIIGVERSGYIVDAMQPPFFAWFEKASISQKNDRISAEKAWAWYRSYVYEAEQDTLAVIWPHPSLMPNKALANIHSGLLKSYGEKMSTYSHPSGLKGLREAISNHLATRHFYCNAENIQITYGCMHAIELALLSVAKAGDEIIVLTPCFPGYIAVFNNLGFKPVEIPLISQKINLEAFEKTFKKTEVKAAILSSVVHNPTGLSFSEEEKKAIAKLAAKYEKPVIEDDIFGDLHFSEATVKPIASYPNDDYVIYCSSFSKTLAPGERIGWCIGGMWHKKIADRFASSLFTVNSRSQYILAHYLSSSAWPRHLRKLRAVLFKRSNLIRKLILEYFPQGTQVCLPSGGYVLWIELPESNGGSKLWKEAMKHGIYVLPGLTCSATPSYKNAIRVSLSYDESKEAHIKTHIKKLAHLATQSN
ncbi:aminotransferase-like domain-containing protein [Zooshikella harenae]|uniref:PLP-dependent aminotransferase family protein n=1 Tax=Zooshikella harenae TaxID=2827238 RepID=A0ABS5Z9J8_9GAMM|nr:PLP-dependent aminotransferase family protein [Zooshikella harenae]MBU2710720.1 PLP-dependent aminotransferase family protein [Zooshikella harenae]